MAGQARANTYEDFWEYMELIFMYAGTASLAKELDKVGIEDAQIGDVLIQGGHPGHAVIIVDQVVDTLSGDARFLLAQSYMPAQDLQILLNPTDSEISPWYELKAGEIVTPEWLFSSNDLMRFR